MGLEFAEIGMPRYFQPLLAGSGTEVKIVREFAEPFGVTG